MTAFYQNAYAQTFAGQNTKPAVLAQRPWARARTAAIKGGTVAGATVAGSAALNTSVGQMKASGGKAPYTYAMNNSDGGNFSITSGGLIQTGKAPPMSAPNPGVHTVQIAITDASSNTAVVPVPITVT
jgi:hypothetical protein